MTLISKYGWLAAATIALACPQGPVHAQETRPAAKRFAFFPLDNGLGRGVWSPEEQARVAQEAGCDGIGYNDTNRPEDIDHWLAAMSPRGLKLYSLYIYTFPDKPAAERYPSHLRETIRKLKGTDTIIWMTLRETQDKSKTAHDDACVAMVNEVADWAKESGLKVALYPHTGFYVASAEEALRIVEKVHRPDVGMTINVCHELMQHNGDRIIEMVERAGPRLFLVTINGADKDGKNGGTIQPLGQGNYDVYAFLKALKKAGYQGPVGLQCYSVPGDQKENLRASMTAWKEYRKRLDAEGK